jgi:hypothetical protein
MDQYVIIGAVSLALILIIVAIVMVAKKDKKNNKSSNNTQSRFVGVGASSNCFTSQATCQSQCALAACSATYPSGYCLDGNGNQVAGSCNQGVCPCNSRNPNGSCPSGQVCVNGSCQATFQCTPTGCQQQACSP